MILLVQHLSSLLFELFLFLPVVVLQLAHAKCALRESLARESKIVFVSARCTDGIALLQAQNILTRCKLVCLRDIMVNQPKEI